MGQDPLPEQPTVRGSDVRACSSNVDSTEAVCSARSAAVNPLSPPPPPHAPDRSHKRRRFGGSGKHRLQDFTGQTAAATSTASTAGLRPGDVPRPGAPQLRRDQIRQPTKPQRARHVARVQLGQHRQLPIPQPGKLRFELGDRYEQLAIRSGSKLLDHIFDSTRPNADRQAGPSENRLTLKGKRDPMTVAGAECNSSSLRL